MSTLASESFLVASAPADDVGRSRVRIHYTRRKGAPRFTVMKLARENPRKVIYACSLGHEGKPEEIQMDFDTRQALGVEPGETIDLETSKASLPGRMCWYWSAADPAIRIPAWLAVWSVGLGGLGLALSAFSVWKGWH